MDARELDIELIGSAPQLGCLFVNRWLIIKTENHFRSYLILGGT